MAILKYCLFVAILLFAVFSCDAYEVVMKNGKKLQGTILHEDGNMIVLQDSSGIKMNLKKANIDTEKTAAANASTAENPVAPKPAEKAAPAKAQTPGSLAEAAKKQNSGKKARTLTEEDLDQLREKYDLGEGTFSEESAEENKDSDETDAASEEKESGKNERTESDWKQEAESLQGNVKQAQQNYDVISKQCEQMKSWTLQSDTLYDAKGKQLNIQEEREKMCADAERAKQQLEQAKNEYSSFVSQARREGVPRGWIGDPDE